MNGVVLLNLGGPSTLDEVRPFLYKLFSDPAVLVGIPAPFRQALAFLISTTKGASSKKMYAAIGGGSPQLRWTETQAKLLEETLNARDGGSWRVAVGMLASRPSIREALQSLRAQGAETLTALPLFPQFSTTTTGSCFEQVRRELRRMRWNPPLKEIPRWPDDGAYADLLAGLVTETCATLEADGALPFHLLLSAHSLPMKIIERGDPYPREVERTVASLMDRVRLPAGCTWSLAFQSRNGPIPWLRPYTDHEIERLARNGTRALVVAPISFVSDHIETLFEIDILFRGLAGRAGITRFERVPSFNGISGFGQVLAGLVGRPETPVFSPTIQKS